MAESKGNIEGGIEEKDDRLVAVESITEEVPSEADASSQPGPYDDLDVNRPPVSTNRPDVPIAQSLVAGAGAPTGEPEVHPEEYVADNAYVSAADKDNMEKAPGPSSKEKK